MSFATLDEAWGPSQTQSRDSVNVQSIPKRAAKEKKANQPKPRVKKQLDNIMDVYTSDRNNAGVSETCHLYATYPPPQDYDFHMTYDDADDEKALEKILEQMHEKIPEVPDRDGSVTDGGPATPSVPVPVPITIPMPSSTSTSTNTSTSTSTSTSRPVVETYVEKGGDKDNAKTEPERLTVYMLDMLMYIVSGVLLIFMMEQLLRIGVSMRVSA
jgi:hypothetical protein